MRKFVRSPKSYRLSELEENSTQALFLIQESSKALRVCVCVCMCVCAHCVMSDTELPRETKLKSETEWTSLVFLVCFCLFGHFMMLCSQRFIAAEYERN